MIKARVYQYLLPVALLTALGLPAAQAQLQAPMLARKVQAGQLPPLNQRLPEVPLRMQMPEPGRYGGQLRTLMGRAKDIRLMSVYGYTRLVGYDNHYALRPDILESIEVDRDRQFTLHLRKGHRWSDGEPFSSEDFRYWWRDIANNRELSPFGPPAVLLVEGKPPLVEFPDDRTIRYRWNQPNPFFLPALAASRPLYIYAPAHYLKQFHAGYADRDQLNARARANGQRDWVAMHVRKFRPYKNTNPDLPTLQPWKIITPEPAIRFEFARNPFFHRVDEHGRQLPYIDQVIITIADGKLIPAKTGAGESDLQARHLKFSDYTFLKASEVRTNNRVRLWKTTKGAHLALYPNLNCRDAGWRGLMRDVRFRRALSLAINRHEINQVIYYGLAIEGNNTVDPDSPLYQARYKQAWTEYDPARANALLDDLGLTRRDSQGLRLLPDGRPMEIIVETGGEDTEQSDVLELIESTWREIGIKLYTKPLQREVFRNRIFAGQSQMSIWGGLENGLATAAMSPRELAPTDQMQLQWPKWGQFFQTGGKVGEAPDLPKAEKLLALNQAWGQADSDAKRRAIWGQMLEIQAQQVYTLGIVSGVPQPVVVNAKLRNVPQHGVYNWEPGAHFGIYHPDTFWFSSKGGGS